MSPLVTRPSLPEPGTVVASTPLSAESLRTEGASGASDGATLGAAGVGAAAARLGRRRRSSWLGRGRGSSGLGGSASTVIDQAEQRTDSDRVAILRGDLAE